MGWLSTLWHAVQPALMPLALLVAPLIHATLIKTPNDAERAAALARIVDDTVALALKLFPNLANNYGELLKQVVNLLSSISSVPTKNPVVLERAAAGGLARAGKLPPAS